MYLVLKDWQFPENDHKILIDLWISKSGTYNYYYVVIRVKLYAVKNWCNSVYKLEQKHVNTRTNKQQNVYGDINTFSNKIWCPQLLFKSYGSTSLRSPIYTVQSETLKDIQVMNTVLESIKFQEVLGYPRPILCNTYLHSCYCLCTRIKGSVICTPVNVHTASFRYTPYSWLISLVSNPIWPSWSMKKYWFLILNSLSRLLNIYKYIIIITYSHSGDVSKQ